MELNKQGEKFDMGDLVRNVLANTKVQPTNEEAGFRAGVEVIVKETLDTLLAAVAKFEYVELRNRFTMDMHTFKARKASGFADDLGDNEIPERRKMEIHLSKAKRDELSPIVGFPLI